MRLDLIYTQSEKEDVTLTRLAHWYDWVDKSGFTAFGTIARTIQTHYLEIVTFFHKRSTNCSSRII